MADSATLGISNIAGQLPTAGGLGGLRSLTPSQQARMAPMLASAFGQTFWTAFALSAAVAFPPRWFPDAPSVATEADSSLERSPSAAVGRFAHCHVGSARGASHPLTAHGDRR